MKLSSFKSNENIQKKEGEPDSTVSNNQFSSVTLNELAMNARECVCVCVCVCVSVYGCMRKREREREREREHTIISNIREAVNPKADINPKCIKIAQTCLEYMNQNLLLFLISQNISAHLKGPKVKNKLHYG